MKKLLLSIALLLSLSGIQAQTILKDGVYQSVKTAKVKDVATGQSYKDSKGNLWPVYKTSTGRLYALRTSKNGKEYKQYLN